MQKKTSELLLIYGTGLVGRRVHKALEARKYHVHGFLDQDESLHEIDGLPVTHTTTWARRNDTSKTRVIMGLLDSQVDSSEVISKLNTQGYDKVVNIVELIRDYLDGAQIHYWLAHPCLYKENAKKIQNLRKNLADDSSRILLDRIIEFRVSGDSRLLPPPSPKQYFPDDIPRWPETLRYIDCGGYTGDTVQALQNAGHRLEAVATFEPNLIQYSILTENLKEISTAIHFPCGVSDTTRLSGFDPGRGATGHLLKGGSEKVVCVRLDEALPNFAPNLIKMDIEGEELAALRGSQNLIKQFRPNLAISVYHRAEHLWEIYELINSITKEYRYFLRCHAKNSFETILYCLNQKSNP